MKISHARAASRTAHRRDVHAGKRRPWLIYTAPASSRITLHTQLIHLKGIVTLCFLCNKRERVGSHMDLHWRTCSWPLREPSVPPLPQTPCLNPRNNTASVHSALPERCNANLRRAQIASAAENALVFVSQPLHPSTSQGFVLDNPFAVTPGRREPCL